MKNTSRLAAMAMMAFAGMAGLATAQSPSPTGRIQVVDNGYESGNSAQRSVSPSRQAERNSIEKALVGGFSNWRKARFPNGPGWTHAHVGRMARKRRNKSRNKRAHRG